jgi:hypothetical chaperone protein
MAQAVGVDFGTTNSSLAFTEGEGAPRLARFARGDGSETSTFRSILYFERGERRDLLELAGPRAIARYLDADEPGRLIQSLKSFLASRDFSSTSVFGEPYRLEALIAIILRQLREQAEAQLGEMPERIAVGRPVRFADARNAGDEDFALTRLRAAFANAGYPEVVFEYEPVAAAYHYERELDHDELILIADFGGGTSDFSLVHVGPTLRGQPRRPDSILGTDGVPLAGDAFDGRIVRNIVAPLLGLGAKYRSIFNRVLPVPSWLYSHLQRWHHLSFLKSPSTLQILFDLRREALEPERFDALLHLVQADLGFDLFRAVEGTKLELSRSERATFRFEHDPVSIGESIARRDFVDWIAPELEAVEECVSGLLARAAVAPSNVDRVFLTGGSSLVPAVRGLFERRFGPNRIRSGGELTSVASGLALRARELCA